MKIPTLEIKPSPSSPGDHTVAGWDSLNLWAHHNIPEWYHAMRSAKLANLSESDQQKRLCSPPRQYLDLDTREHRYIGNESDTSNPYNRTMTQIINSPIPHTHPSPFREGDMVFFSAMNEGTLCSYWGRVTCVCPQDPGYDDLGYWYKTEIRQITEGGDRGLPVGTSIHVPHSKIARFLEVGIDLPGKAPTEPPSAVKVPVAEPREIRKDLLDLISKWESDKTNLLPEFASTVNVAITELQSVINSHFPRAASK